MPGLSVTLSSTVSCRNIEETSAFQCAIKGVSPLYSQSFSVCHLNQMVQKYYINNMNEQQESNHARPVLSYINAGVCPRRHLAAVPGIAQ